MRILQTLSRNFLFKIIISSIITVFFHVSGEKKNDAVSVNDLKLALTKEIISNRPSSDSLNKMGNSDIKIFYTFSPGEKYKCCACGEVLKHPVKFENCGHSCCSSCFSDIMT